MSLSSAPTSNARYRRIDRLRGLVIVGVSFALCLVLSVWAKKKSTPVISAPPDKPTPTGVVGFPSAVDAVKTLPRARQLTPRSLLRGVVAEGVKSDGLVDAASERGRVRYSFQSAVGEGPEPAREPGTLARRPYCGRQTVLVNKEGIGAEIDAADAMCATHPSDPLPDPRCTLADVWAHALTRGVPREKLARVEYFRANAGPAWRFDVPHARGRFVLYGDCQRELDGPDAVAVAQ
jgi:hypothetical protein